MYERWLEVSHEALIRGWPQLREWLSDREGQRLRAQITESAKEWEQHKRDDSVLYRSVRLAQALEWREKEVNRPITLMTERPPYIKRWSGVRKR